MHDDQLCGFFGAGRHGKQRVHAQAFHFRLVDNFRGHPLAVTGHSLRLTSQVSGRADVGRKVTEIPRQGHAMGYAVAMQRAQFHRLGLTATAQRKANLFQRDLWPAAATFHFCKGIQRIADRLRGVASHVVRAGVGDVFLAEVADNIAGATGFQGVDCSFYGAAKSGFAGLAVFTQANQQNTFRFDPRHSRNHANGTCFSGQVALSQQAANLAAGGLIELRGRGPKLVFFKHTDNDAGSSSFRCGTRRRKVFHAFSFPLPDTELSQQPRRSRYTGSGQAEENNPVRFL